MIRGYRWKKSADGWTLISKDKYEMAKIYLVHSQFRWSVRLAKLHGIGTKDGICWTLKAAKAEAEKVIREISEGESSC